MRRHFQTLMLSFRRKLLQVLGAVPKNLEPVASLLRNSKSGVDSVPTDSEIGAGFVPRSAERLSVVFRRLSKTGKNFVLKRHESRVDFLIKNHEIGVISVYRNPEPEAGSILKNSDVGVSFVRRNTETSEFCS